MIIESIILIGGLLLLVKGSDLFVKAAASTAKKVGVSEFVIGLTLIAVGTSLPELVSAIFASIKQQSGLVLGNIVGANIANMGLVIGIAAILSIIKTKQETIERDGYILLFSGLLLLVFLYNGISRIEGVIFLLLYISYTIFLFERKTEMMRKYPFKEFLTYFLKFKYLGHFKKIFARNNISSAKKKTKKNTKFPPSFTLKNVAVLTLSGLAVIIGAHYVVKEAVFFAMSLKVPPTVMGVLISLGTTMPEMSVAITAARKGYSNIALGNSLGSCITNTLLVLGLAATISPLAVTEITSSYTAPFMMLMIILLLIFIRSEWRITKKEGIILLATYLGFLLWILSKAVA